MEHLCIASAQLKLELHQILLVYFFEGLGCVSSSHDLFKNFVFVHVLQFVFARSHPVQLVLSVLTDRKAGVHKSLAEEKALHHADKLTVAHILDICHPNFIYFLIQVLQVFESITLDDFLSTFSILQKFFVHLRKLRQVMVIVVLLSGIRLNN